MLSYNTTIALAISVIAGCGGGGGGGGGETVVVNPIIETVAFEESKDVVTWTTDASSFYANTPLFPRPGDFNNDGYMDVIVTYAGTKNPAANKPNGPHTAAPIKIFLNDQAGGFYDGTSEIIDGAIPKTLFIRTKQIGDFNGDGLSDVFLGDAPELDDDREWWAYPDVLLLSNAATGKLEDHSDNMIWTEPNWRVFPALNYRYTHESDQMDYDGDGDIDLLLATTSKSGAVVMINDGSGVFTEYTGMGKVIDNSISINASALKSVFADVNNNTLMDIIIPGQTNNNAVFLNNNSDGYLNQGGDFDTLAEIALPASLLSGPTEDIEATDVNGDGAIDVILLNTNFVIPQHFLQVLIGDGNGNFTDETATRFDTVNTWTSNSSPLIDVIDMNNDNVKDIVLTTHIANPAGGLFLNTLIYINHNGTFKLADHNLPATMSEYAIADYNKDGLMDFMASTNTVTTEDNVSFTHRMVLVDGNEVITVE